MTDAEEELLPPAEQHAPVATLSKNAQKRLVKQAQWEERKQAMKAQRKAKAKQESERRRAELQQVLDSLSPEELQARRDASRASRAKKDEQKRALEEHKAASLTSPWTIIIDCGLSHLMTPKEVNSMVLQMVHCYSANCKAPCPGRLCFVDLTGDLADGYDKYSGSAAWRVLRSGHGLKESFKEDAARLVYLTADSPNELTELKQDDMYVIGGLVDRNRHKGITLRKAEAEGIRHAKLPLQQHCQLSGSAVLTVNQVVDLLLAWLDVRDWRIACNRAVPPRKRAAEGEAQRDGSPALRLRDDGPEEQQEHIEVEQS